MSTRAYRNYLKQQFIEKTMLKMIAEEEARCRIEPRYKPSTCPHCEHDRRHLGHGGWLEQDNNGPIVPCPVCNPDGDYPRS